MKIAPEKVDLECHQVDASASAKLPSVAWHEATTMTLIKRA